MGSNPISATIPEAEQRARVIQAARSWIGTPFHDNACIPGVGVACGPMMLNCYQAAGIVAPAKIPHLAPDWGMHTRDEIYLKIVETFGHRVEMPQPGDTAMFRLALTFCHSGIITEEGWPMIIEARWRQNVQVTNALKDPYLSRAKVLFLSPWPVCSSGPQTLEP